MHNRRPIRKPKRRSAGKYHGGGRYGRSQKGKVTYLPIVIILCLSVGCGYATAKYVVEPAVNYVPQITAQKIENNNEEKEEGQGTGEKNEEILKDKVEVKEAGKISGYAVQLGCFSTRDSAEALMKTYNIEGLQIVEQNKLYKIMGKVYNSKEEAKKALDDMSDEDRKGAFIATIYE